MKFILSPEIPRSRLVAESIHSLVRGGASATTSATTEGTFSGALPAAHADNRRFTLSLRGDGTASLCTVDFDQGVVIERGRWSRNGADVILQLNAAQSPIIWRKDVETLLPTEWNRIDWGIAGPPVLARH